MSKEPGVIILDSRSDFRFERIHVKGAKHLAFTDYTQDNLKKVIPTFETKILIYCNNNFDGNQTDFASKVALPRREASQRSGDPIRRPSKAAHDGAEYSHLHQSVWIRLSQRLRVA